MEFERCAQNKTPSSSGLRIETFMASSPSRRKDLIAAPALEATLILILALAGYLSRQPLIFASLGPTAFELIETPNRSSARPYNVIAGHLIAVLAAFLALWITHAWQTPSVVANPVPLPRVLAATLAAMLTVFGTLLLRARQPAALSTTLLIATGVMQTFKDGALIMIAVVLMVIIGEPMRRLRAKSVPD